MGLKYLDLICIFGLFSCVLPCAYCACEPGWYEYYDNCYYVSTLRYNHRDMEHFCSKRNASMWVWHSLDELHWISKLIEAGTRILYWTDLQLVNRRWTFMDGTPYNSRTVPWFRKKEGDRNSNSNKCAALYSYPPDNGTVQARRCTDGWGTICVRPKAMLDFCDLADGWQYVDGRCLKFFDQLQTWSGARQICQANQGDLTIFKDYDQLRSLDSLLTCRTLDNIAWIGLSDTVQPRLWKWINNDTVRYSRWFSYANQILVNGSTCAATSVVDGWAWRHYTCDSQLKFICNRSLGVCPAGWLQNQDRCYDPNVVDTSKKTWFDAKTYCENIGATLLIINNQAEQVFVNSTLNALKVDRAWLGFSDMNQSDVLQWLDGRAVSNASSYQLWDKNFPKAIPKRFDCGLVVRGLVDARWSNRYCFQFNAFLCEMAITTVPFNPTTAPVYYTCDANWVLYRNKCYYFGPVGQQSLKKWRDASDYCKGYDGNLVVIGDPYEMSFVTVQQSKIVTAWIGLKYDKSSDAFLWVDGTSPGQYWANETNFYPGEPDDYKNGQECIQIIGGRRDFTGSWDDGNCSIPQGFVCEKNAVPAVILPPSGPPVPTAISPACGFGWVYSTSNNFCYQVVLGQPKTWQGARAFCQQNGGDLLSISGVSEQNFVQAILSTGKYATLQLNFWIGATDQTQEGGWHWTDNTPFRYLNWHSNEPNNYLSWEEDCAEIVPSWNYQWNDKYCTKEQVFICKKNAQMTTAVTLVPPTGFNKGKCQGEAMISGNYSVVDSGSFTSSSTRDAQHLAVNSRLFQNSIQGGGWSAKTSGPNQYIAVTFYNTIVVKAIITAGRTDADEWVTQYMIQYQESYFSEWLTYNDPPGTTKIFTANNDSSTPVTNTVFFPFEAKQVKLIPTKWHAGISLRWEILGCLEESCTPDYAVSGPLVALDSQLTASSIFDIAHDSKTARLRPVTQGVTPACWKPQVSDTNQWIQVNLGNVMVIRGVTVRGNPAAQEWVTKYRVKYSLSSSASFAFYQEPFGTPMTIIGNTDSTSPVTYYFKSHFQARFVRIVPMAWNASIALAFDVLVCQNGCDGSALISGSHHIPDSQLGASSVLDKRHTVARSRLNLPANGAYSGAWIPRYSDNQQYLKADLGFPVQITAVATQGAFDSQDWVKTYTLSYSNDNTKWVYYYELGSKPKVFNGNWENRIARKHYLLIPFITRYILIHPQTWNNRIAVRWEVYGCPGAASGVKIGCFADDIHNRDLSFEPYFDPKIGMWPPMCVDHCFRKGYYYAGLQGQFKCFCGNSYGRFGPATDCTLACFPKTNFKCGGPKSNIIYTTGMTPEFKICPTNWKAYNNRCYVLLQDKLTWYDARASCKRQGADLASPNSQAEQDFAYSLLQYGSGANVWIGFNDIQDESLFNWADGRQVHYTNWGLNQPSHTANANQDCVLMQSKSGGWQDESCDISHMSICQMDKQPASQPVVTRAPAGCQKGWDGYRWSCYLYADAKRSWQDSRSVCETFGGSLVHIDDKYEQAYLSGVLGSRNGQYWTDVNDLPKPGTYQHTVGRPGVQYTNWAMNKPDGTSQCVSIGSGNMTGLWSNQPCSNKVGLICEKMRVGYTAPPLPPATTSLTPCDPGLIQTSNYCYQVNKKPPHLQRTWLEAQQDCVSKGGNLASFHTAADIDLVWRTALVGTESAFWIGLNDKAAESGYVWSDRSAVNALNWADKQPDNYNGFEDCVEMWSSTSKWNDASCMSRNDWLCMVKRGPGGHFTTLKTVTAPATQSSSVCSSLTAGIGWVAYNGSCYYANDGKGDNGKSWRQARKTCQLSGGDLASILTPEEQAFVYLTLLKNVSAEAVWIGLNALNLNTGFKWSDGSPVKYTNWKTNEPNNAGGEEDCVDIFLRTGGWNDDHCAYQNGYVCKVHVGATPVPPVPTAFWAGNCPTGFSLLYNRCYRIYPTPVNWTTALSNCKALGPGYNLASILDDVTNAFITTKMASMKVNPWIGLKKNWGGQLLWVNNDETTYTNWAYSEPNGKQKEACVQIMSYPGKVGKWNDVSCSTAHGYVCMTRKDPSIHTPEPIPSICDVKQGQKLFQTGCYFYSSQALNWSAANGYCIKQGGYLSSINSAFEQAYIYLTMKKNGANAIWIGLNDIKLSGTYTWADGWPVLYTNWDAGQPAGGQGCVMANATGKWTDTNCSSTYQAVCKISSATPSLTPPAPNGQCDPGWYSFGSHCYFLGIHLPRTAIDAGFFCQHNQSALVSIHNQSENQFLVKTMTSLAVQGQSFWTGLHKSIDSGFQWIDRSPVQYTNWRKGEPSTRGWSGNLENCAEVFLSDGQWNDEDCNSKRLFICEKVPAVDTGKIIIGTGGAPINIPTPIPFTRPSILPIQKTPSPPTSKSHSGSNPPPVTPRPSVSQIVPQTVPNSRRTFIMVSDTAKPTGRLPTISLKPYTGGSTLAPLQQSSNMVTGIGLTPGALAGVILAAVVVVLLVVLIAMYWRRNTAAGKKTNFGLGDQGFDNKTYRYDTANEQVTESTENNAGINLRTLSESST